MTSQRILELTCEDLLITLDKISTIKFDLYVLRPSDKPIQYDILLIPVTLDFSIINHNFREDRLYKSHRIIFSFIGKTILAIYKTKKCIKYYVIENDTNGNTKIITKVKSINEIMNYIMTILLSQIRPYSISI